MSSVKYVLLVFSGALNSGILNRSLCRSLCVVLVLLSVFSGCGGRGEKRQLPHIPLLAPSALLESLQYSQAVTFHAPTDAQGKEATAVPMLGAWSCSKRDGLQRLDFVAVTASGQTLMKLSYDGSTYTEEYAAILQRDIPGREILSQLQMTYWPRAEIEKTFAGTVWRIDGDGDHRQIYYHQRLFLDIRKNIPSDSDTDSGTGTENILERIIVTDVLRGYSLLIETFTKEILP